MSITDLKTIRHFLSQKQKSGHEHTPNDFCTTHGPSSTSCISTLCRKISGSSQNQTLYLPRTIFLHGLRSTHLQRKFARYRGVSACSTEQTLPYGAQEWNGTQHISQCQSFSRLAHICRLRTSFDQHSQTSLCRRRVRCRTQRNCLCPRLIDHRSLSGLFSLGALSQK